LRTPPAAARHLNLAPIGLPVSMRLWTMWPAPALIVPARRVSEELLS
jgi:hypothetical protein